MSTEVTYQEFAKNYKVVTGLWPNKLNVSNQYDVGQRGYRIPKLTDAHDTVESVISSQYVGTECDVLMAVEFALYTQLHNRIRSTRQEVITHSDMSFEQVKNIFESYDAWKIVDDGPIATE